MVVEVVEGIGYLEAVSGDNHRLERIGGAAHFVREARYHLQQVGLRQGEGSEAVLLNRGVRNQEPGPGEEV